MFLTILPETLSEDEQLQYKKKMSSIVNFDDKTTRDLFGTMSGKSIASFTEYFLAHVKNDIQVISKELRFGDPVSIFDWLRASLSKMVEEMHFKATNYQAASSVVCEHDIESPGQLIIDQEKNIQAMIETDLSSKTIIKNMFFRKINNRLLYQAAAQHNEEMENIYKFCRHTKYNRQAVFESFNKQLEQSPHTLLKKVVKYSRILTDFPRIVKANLDLSYYLMNNYSRLYNFDEAT